MKKTTMIPTILLAGVLSACNEQEWKSNRECLYIAREFPEDPECPKLAYEHSRCSIPDYMSAFTGEIGTEYSNHLTVRQWCALVHAETGK